MKDHFKKKNYEIAIETNGTCLPPDKIDWICVSPKNNTNSIIKNGDELKFVYPQSNFEPQQFENFNFNHFFIQPMDGINYNKNIKMSKKFIEKNPKWKLSLQTHKILGFP